MATTQTDPGRLGRKIADGAVWVVAMRMAVRSLGLVSTIILARLLTPADFGLMALSALLVSTLEIASAFNFEVWLVRHPDPQRTHYDSVWTLSVLRGVLLFIVLLSAAEPAGSVFDEPRLPAVVQAVAFASLLAGLVNVGVVDFQRHLDFGREFLLLVASRVVSFTVTVGLGIALRSYWALVAGVVTLKLTELILSYVLHHYRPRPAIAGAGEVFRFSRWLLAGSVFGFAYARLDTFIIGKLLSSQTLGLYAVAHEIASLASSEIVTPIRRVLLPAYASMNRASDPQAVRDGFLQGFGVIVLVGVPIACGIGLLADPLVQLLLGDQWLDAIPLIRVLAIYGVTAVAMANQGPVLIAVGRPGILSGLYALSVLLLAPTCWLATRSYGSIGAAWAVALTNVVMLLVSLTATLRITGSTAGALLRVSWRSVLAALLMCGAVSALLETLTGFSVFLTLLLAALLGAVVYVATASVLWIWNGQQAGPEQIIVRAARERFAGVS